MKGEKIKNIAKFVYENPNILKNSCLIQLTVRHIFEDSITQLKDGQP